MQDGEDQIIYVDVDAQTVQVNMLKPVSFKKFMSAAVIGW